jgi:hypothetical protein
MTPVPALFSAAWFRLLARPGKGPERRAGTRDLRFVVRTLGGARSETLHAVGIALASDGHAEVCDSPETAGFDPDFTLEGPYAAWEEMVESIQAHGGADAAHTLRTLTAPGAPLRVRGSDPSRVDLFAQHARPLQQFFDDAAEVTL